MKTYQQKRLGAIRPGDVIVNAAGGNPRVVRYVDQAVARGYLIIEYEDGGERGGGHKSDPRLLEVQT